MGFVLFALGIVAAIHLYLWQRLVRDTAGSRRWRRGGGLAVLAAALVLVATMFGEPLLPAALSWLVAPGYVWLGVMFYLLLALLAVELPVLVVTLVSWLVRHRRAARTRVEQGATPAPTPAGVRATAPAGGTAAGAAGVGAAAGPGTPAGGTARTPGGTASDDPVAARPVADAPDRLADGDRDPGRSPGPGRAVDLGRRRFLRRGAAVAAGAAALSLSGYGVVRAYGAPRVTQLRVPLAGLDPRADGLRVVVLADLHVGPLYRAAQVRRVVETVNRLDADLVTVVGDMVSSEVGAVREQALPLRRLRSRYGAYFVTGNHEYYTGHEEWIEAADELGLRVLRNQRVEIAHRGGAIDLAGVNDREGSRFDDPPDYAAALGDRDPSRPVVLLAHQPVQVHEAAAYGVDLQLSGHTHGGQLYPFDALVRLDQPMVSGLGEIDGTQVYVTNGAGFWGPPMRVGADPEITLIELRSA